MEEKQEKRKQILAFQERLNLIALKCILENQGSVAGIASRSFNLGTDQTPWSVNSSNILDSCLHLETVLDEHEGFEVLHQKTFILMNKIFMPCIKKIYVDFEEVSMKVDGRSEVLPVFHIKATGIIIVPCSSKTYEPHKSHRIVAMKEDAFNAFKDDESLSGIENVDPKLIACARWEKVANTTGRPFKNVEFEEKEEPSPSRHTTQTHETIPPPPFITTPAHFSIFKEEAQYWIDKFGLKGYKVFFLHRDRDKDEDGNPRGFANYNASVIGRNAVLCLSKTWNDQGLQDGITEDQIRGSAFHEVWELLLHRLFHLASNRAYTEHDFDEEKHNIIRIMENVVWREDWEGRKGEDPHHFKEIHCNLTLDEWLGKTVPPPFHPGKVEFRLSPKEEAYEKYLKEMLSDPKYQWLEEEGSGKSADTSDRGLLAWIHQRMVKVHNEDPLVDYMHRLRDIVFAMPKGVKSPPRPAYIERLVVHPPYYPGKVEFCQRPEKQDHELKYPSTTVTFDPSSLRSIHEAKMVLNEAQGNLMREHGHEQIVYGRKSGGTEEAATDAPTSQPLQGEAPSDTQKDAQPEQGWKVSFSEEGGFTHILTKEEEGVISRSAEVIKNAIEDKVMDDIKAESQSLTKSKIDLATKAINAFNERESQSFEGREIFRGWLKDAIAKIETCMNWFDYPKLGREIELPNVCHVDFPHIAWPLMDKGKRRIGLFVASINKDLADGIFGIEILVKFRSEIVGKVMVKPDGTLDWHDEPGLRIRPSMTLLPPHLLQGRPAPNDGDNPLEHHEKTYSGPSLLTSCEVSSHGHEDSKLIVDLLLKELLAYPMDSWAHSISKMRVQLVRNSFSPVIEGISVHPKYAGKAIGFKHYIEDVSLFIKDDKERKRVAKNLVDYIIARWKHRSVSGELTPAQGEAPNDGDNPSIQSGKGEEGDEGK